MMPALKTISFQDGAVTFRIPSNWVEDYDDDGNGEFYDVEDEDRTFRLTLNRAESVSPLPADHARIVLGLSEKYGGSIVEIGDGYFFTSHLRHYKEASEKLTNRFWLLSRMITENLVHVASFTYTYPDALKDDARTLNELKILGEATRSAMFYNLKNPSGENKNRMD